MKELDFFKKQFLFTTHDNFKLPWNSEKILNYTLYYHPDLSYEHSIYENVELYLLGFLFDHSNPEFSNSTILNSLVREKTFDSFLESILQYSGHFVIIYKSGDTLVILNDSCSQNEIYYDLSFSTFGTQPKLLNTIIPALAHTSDEAVRFYSSPIFLKTKLFIGDTTPYKNILHLLPNHFIDIGHKQISRYFPKEPINFISVNDAAMEAQEMLQGYIKAASMRQKLALGVTGGYDSRLLFLSSLNIESKYYVTKLEHMDDRHPDIVIPKKLAKLYKKPFSVINESNEINDELLLDSSIDFPRYPKRPSKEFSNHIIINGNISEISRHRNNCYKKVTPEDIAYLYGYSNCKFVINEIEKWYESSKNIFTNNGYHLIDMFYWEHKMGIWAAKSKTEMNALDTIVYSPFCSNKLITTLLSTPLKYRDPIDNKLYNLIIKNLSPKATGISINPSFKRSIKKVFTKLKLLNIYRKIGLKLRIVGTYYHV